MVVILSIAGVGSDLAGIFGDFSEQFSEIKPRLASLLGIKSLN